MNNDTGSNGYKYGSVSAVDEESAAKGGDKNFDETNLYYVKEGNLTTADKTAKAVKLAVPIIIATLFIGGLAFMLFHNFAYFYPGRGGHGKSSSIVDSPTPTPRSHHDNKTPSILPPTVTFPPVEPTPACATNPKCVDLGLRGECCPTEHGVHLECCS